MKAIILAGGSGTRLCRCRWYTQLCVNSLEPQIKMDSFPTEESYIRIMFALAKLLN